MCASLDKNVFLNGSIRLKGGQILTYQRLSLSMKARSKTALFVGTLSGEAMIASPESVLTLNLDSLGG